MLNHTTLTVQQLQPSTYSHPCGDLLDGGKRREFLDLAVPLYRASIEGDLEATQAILLAHSYLVRYSITEKMDTPLHVAASSHSTELVRYLVTMMNEDDLELHNGDGNTAFCIAAISGNVGMVEIMFMKNEALPTICGSENMMPLYLAAFYGNSDVVTFLYNQSDKMRGWINENRNGVLLKCIQANMFDVALRILDDNEELPQDKHAWDMLEVLAEKRWAFLEHRPSKLRRLLAFTGLVKRPALKERNATLLLRLLWKRIMEKPKDVIDKILRGPMTIMKKSPGHLIETYPSQILFIAAKMNNTPFLVELIHEYPDLIWMRNDDEQTIFHIAVAHRHPETYNLVYKIGSVKDLITPIIDQQGNNILHLAGKIPEKTAYDKDWVAAPFQTRREHLWYKAVEGTLPPPCRKVKNAAGQTPRDLYKEKRKDLAFEGVKWINKTVNQSMVVAALVCTIGFSAVFTVPGGFDQSNGYPIFLRNKHFIGFILLDSASFLLSSSSIVTFMTITLSRQQGKAEILLSRWMNAQLLLLMSIATLTIAFASSFAFVYRKGFKIKLMTYEIYMLDGCVLMFCGFWYYSLFKDLIWASYTLNNLFKAKNHTLYRKK